GPHAAPAVPELTRLLRDDADSEVRMHAALSLGGIGKASESAVNLLLQKIQDAKEAHAVRVESAMALARIGKVPTSRDIVPALLDVLRSPKHDSKVRERVMWSLRVHAGDLRGKDKDNRDLPQLAGVKSVFIEILDEPPTFENKMLRYDCAYMLGMVWQSNAPPKALERLHDFLCDKDVKVYDTTATGVGGGGNEVKGGAATVKERGIGDGRTMATAALEAMGPQLYGSRADIIRQLRVLANDPMTYGPLRDSAKKLLSAAGQ
ncbi:MAG: HEAT repeat domain-containing protein, partial [Planctomycetes bacterium]|nr:HEAT repeat domain-containing protein [Planctomycetota bacterium]